jgi:hypothetical protein
MQTHTQRKEKEKNLCLKTRPKENPYEVWKSYNEQWTWNVLKKWQSDDNKYFSLLSRGRVRR